MSQCCNNSISEVQIGSASLASFYSNSVPLSPPHWPYRSVSDHRAGRVWRSRHRSKTPNCLPSVRDHLPTLLQNTTDRCGASVEPNSGVPITPSRSTFDFLRRITNPLSLLNWWFHMNMNMHYFKFNRIKIEITILSHTCNRANWHAHKQKRQETSAPFRQHGCKNDQLMNDWNIHSVN